VAHLKALFNPLSLNVSGFDAVCFTAIICLIGVLLLVKMKTLVFGCILGKRPE